MSIAKLVSGPVGSGKTYNAINDFIEAITSGDPLFPSRHCFMIVPEQQTVEIEKQILERGKLSGLISHEIISFNRLVYRILQDANVKTGTPVSPSLSGMLVAKTINDVEKDLIHFKDIAGNPEAVANLTSALAELQKYRVDGETLRSAADHMHSDDPSDSNSSDRLRELALILERYDSVLKEGGYSNGASLAENACSFILSGNSIISGSRIFIDGFTGFTEAELKIIEAISVECDSINVYLFKEASKAPLFEPANKTYEVVYDLLSKNKCCSLTAIEIPVSDHLSTRFKNAKALFDISRYYGDCRFKDKLSDDHSAVTFYTCSDFYHEIHNVCLRINDLVKKDNYTYDDISVAVPSVDKYLYLIDAVFRENGIPVFIDARIEMSGHAVIRFIDAFLNIIAGNRVIDNIIALLKTGLMRYSRYTDDDVDSLEKLTDKYVVRSFDNFKKIIRHYGNATRSKIKVSASCLALGETLIDLFDSPDGFIKKAEKAASVSDLIELVYSFAEKTGLDGYGETLRQESVDDIIFIRVWNVFTDILAECRDTLGQVKVRGYRKLTEYTSKLLKAAVSCYKIGFIPYSESHVKVGDLARSGYVNKKVVFIIGANEGDFPPPPPASSILKDRERTAIRQSGRSTAFTNEEQIFFTEFKVYSVLCAASEKLFMSHSLISSDGSDCGPSRVMRRVSDLFGGLKYNRSMLPEDTENDLTVDPGNDAAILPPELVRLLLNVKDSFNVSSTSVEKLVNCPYSFLLDKVLRIKKYEKGVLQNNMIGTYYHYLLEQSLKSYFKNDSHDVKKNVSDADALFKNDPDNDEFSLTSQINSRDGFLIERAGEYAISEVENIIDISESASFLPEFFEKQFSDGKDGRMRGVDIPPYSEDGIRATVNGKIDRIDKVTLPDGGTAYMVVDYKSRRSAATGSDIGSDDEDVQMKLYYEALKSNSDPSAMTFSVSETNNIHPADTIAAAYYRYGADSDDDDLHLLNTFVDESDDDLIDVLSDSKGSGRKINVHKTDLGSSVGKTLEAVARNIDDALKGSFERRPVLKSGKANGSCSYCSYRQICEKERKASNEN